MGGIRIRMDVSVCFQSICRFCFRAVSVAVVGVSCFSAQASPHPAFEHCRTPEEMQVRDEYIGNPVRLLADLESCVKFQIPEWVQQGSTNNEIFEDYVKTQIGGAVTCISQTDVGKRLLATLTTKMQLKKNALEAMRSALLMVSNETVDKNRDAKVSRFLRVLFHQQFLDSEIGQCIPTIDAVINRVTRESDWEQRSIYVIRDSRSVIDRLNNNDPRLILGPNDVGRMLSEIQQAIDNVDIRISSIRGGVDHAFTCPNGVPSINIDFSKEGQYEGFSCISIPGKSDLTKRNIMLDEILFHELGHALHWMENRSDIVPSFDVHINGGNVSEQLAWLWGNVEEFRNNTGYVLMPQKDMSTSSDTSMRDSSSAMSTSTSEGTLIFMDNICTFLYDYQMRRMPRWPYKVVEGRDVTGLAECVYKDHSLYN